MPHEDQPCPLNIIAVVMIRFSAQAFDFADSHVFGFQFTCGFGLNIEKA